MSHWLRSHVLNKSVVVFAPLPKNKSLLAREFLWLRRAPHLRTRRNSFMRAKAVNNSRWAFSVRTVELYTRSTRQQRVVLSFLCRAARAPECSFSPVQIVRRYGPSTKAI